MRFRGLVVLSVSVAAVLTPMAYAAVTGPLEGTVGPDFTIDLQDATGANVNQLDPGTYDDHRPRPSRSTTTSTSSARG